MDGYNLNTVLKRLEAATSRLEDVLVYQNFDEKPSGPQSGASPGGNSFPATSATGQQPATPQAIPAPASHTKIPNGQSDLPAISTPAGANALTPNQHRESVDLLSPRTSVGSAPRYLVALNAIDLTDFINLSDKFSSELDNEYIANQAHAFEKAWNAMTGIVAKATSMPMPEFGELGEILKPMNELAAEVESIRAECRDAAVGNFLATVLAGVPALGWVAMPDDAAQFVQEMIDSAMFYGNRVLKDNKEAKTWVDAYTTILKSLQGVVKTLKSPWNTNPGPHIDAANSGLSGHPVPPPPPPPSVSQLTASLDVTTPTSNSSGGGMSGVFAELNQGTSIASGLKKTDKAALKSEKPPVPKSSKPKPNAKPPKPTSGKQVTPKIELVDTKWIIEDVTDNHEIDIKAEMGQSVQIDNCNNCTIQIHGKCATFNMSRCNKVGLLTENMVASCDIVNCQSFGLQSTGTLPSLMIDQSHQGSIYLCKESLNIDIFTSQTSAINVNIPGEQPGEFTELPLAEQIVHNIVSDKVKSQVVKHA